MVSGLRFAFLLPPLPVPDGLLAPLAVRASPLPPLALAPLPLASAPRFVDARALLTGSLPGFLEMAMKRFFTALSVLPWTSFAISVQRFPTFCAPR